MSRQAAVGTGAGINSNKVSDENSDDFQAVAEEDMNSFILHRNAYLDGEIQTAESLLFKVSANAPFSWIKTLVICFVCSNSQSWEEIHDRTLTLTMARISKWQTPLAVAAWLFKSNIHLKSNL